MKNEKSEIRLTVIECQALAKETGPFLFDFCGPAGKRKAVWINADIGSYTFIDGKMPHNIYDVLPCGKRVTELPGFWCENIEPIKPS